MVPVGPDTPSPPRTLRAGECSVTCALGRAVQGLRHRLRGFPACPATSAAGARGVPTPLLPTEGSVRTFFSSPVPLKGCEDQAQPHGQECSPSPDGPPTAVLAWRGAVLSVLLAAGRAK